MSFEVFQALMRDSIDFLDPSIDEGRREIYRDAVNQSDTIEELGLLTTIPGIRLGRDDQVERHRSTFLCLVSPTSKVAMMLVITRLVMAHPAVLERHHIRAEDGVLWSIGGGFGDGKRWYSLPHSVGRGKLSSDGDLVWLDDMKLHKDRKYGLLHHFACRQKNTVFEVDYSTYQGEMVRARARIDEHHRPFAVGRLQINGGKTSTGLVPYCDRVVWRDEVSTTSEIFHGWRWFHSASLDRWLKLRIRLKDDEWMVLKSNVAGPVMEGELLGVIESSHDVRDISVRVLKVVSVISDTSGRNMFFPSEYEVRFGDERVWVLRATYENEARQGVSVMYTANGNMNWLGPGRVYEGEKERGECILEAHQLQSIDEVIGTTLQLAGFVDRLDDDTSNDWELFRP